MNCNKKEPTPKVIIMKLFKNQRKGPKLKLIKEKGKLCLRKVHDTWETINIC